MRSWEPEGGFPLSIYLSASVIHCCLSKYDTFLKVWPFAFANPSMPFILTSHIVWLLTLHTYYLLPLPQNLLKPDLATEFCIYSANLGLICQTETQKTSFSFHTGDLYLASKLCYSDVSFMSWLEKNHNKLTFECFRLNCSKMRTMSKGRGYMMSC